MGDDGEDRVRPSMDRGSRYGQREMDTMADVDQRDQRDNKDRKRGRSRAQALGLYPNSNSNPHPHGDGRKGRETMGVDELPPSHSHASALRNAKSLRSQLRSSSSSSSSSSSLGAGKMMTVNPCPQFDRSFYPLPDPHPHPHPHHCYHHRCHHHHL